MLFLLLTGLGIVSYDESPVPNRNYVGEHCALLEQMIAAKIELATVLNNIHERAEADEAAPKVKALAKKDSSALQSGCCSLPRNERRTLGALHGN